MNERSQAKCLAQHLALWALHEVTFLHRRSQHQPRSLVTTQKATKVAVFFAFLDSVVKTCSVIVFTQQKSVTQGSYETGGWKVTARPVWFPT